MKKWKILGKAENKDIISCLLKNRGLKTKAEIKEYLQPRLSSLTIDNLGIKKKGLVKAVKRIKEAIKKAESIVVYTDYDADGICGGAILWETLYNLGAKVMPYVPHRTEEGYGLSKKGIDNLIHQYSANLIITVDHGISAIDKVKYAAKQGVDVVITDHHILPKKLPPAKAIVHTTALSGAGIAWMLAKEIQDKQSSQELKNQLELVAIATIADLVPLIGPNRTLTKFGLEMLNHTRRIGLLALIDEAGLKLGDIGTYQVGHILAPRINAMGRLAHALDALRLLCTRDRQRARMLARRLGFTNRERQQLTEEMYLHARQLYQKLSKSDVGKEKSDPRKLIFIHHQSYSEGIIGLIAGKLVGEYYRPAIVVAHRGRYSKASARSINGFNIVEAIRSLSDLLVDCGGHPMAAGFTVETRNLALLRSKLENIAVEQLNKEILTRVIQIDCQLPLDDISWKLANQLEQFKPYGIGNPQPVFASRGVLVDDARLVGDKGKHLKLYLSNRPDLDVIGFGLGDFYPKLSPVMPVDIAYALDINSWNSKKRLQLKLKDLKIP